MPEDSATNPDQGEGKTENLALEVHWIQHATFYSQIALFLVGIVALIIYYGQLKQMIYATQAAQDSAYDACISAKIARNTLLEYQSGESDTRSSAAGTVAQASASIRQEAGLLNLGTNHQEQVNQNQQGMQMMQSMSPKNWTSLDVLFLYTNIGKSAVKNMKIRYATQLLPEGIEPELSGKGIRYEEIEGATVQPGNITASKPNVRDKDWNLVALGSAELKEFQEGKVYLVSFGRADYIDIFGVKHWQTFCGFFDGREPDPSHPKVLHRTCGNDNRQDSNFLYSIPSSLEAKQATKPIEEIVCTVPKHDSTGIVR